MNSKSSSNQPFMSAESQGEDTADQCAPCCRQPGRDAVHSVRNQLEGVGHVGTRPYRFQGQRKGTLLGSVCWLCAVLVGAWPVSIPAGEANHDKGHAHAGARKPSASSAKTTVAAKPAHLPPLPAGVAELKFSDFFVTPVGARGLDLTDKLRQLDGQRVRMLGYMVHQEEPPPGTFLFSPLPAQVHEHDNGLADDLPPSTVRVLVPTCREQVVPFAPGLMLLTGTLSVGNHAEADGRISIARLALDPPDRAPKSPLAASRITISTPPGKGAEKLMSRISRK